MHRFYVVIMDKKQQHVSRKLCSLSFCFIYVISNYMQGNLIISILCNRIIIQKENNNQYMYLSQLYIHEYMHIVCCTNKMHKIPAMLLQVEGQRMLMVKRETLHPRLSLYIHIYQLSLQCITNTYIFLSCSFCPIIVYKNIIVNNHDCIIILTLVHPIDDCCRHVI